MLTQISIVAALAVVPCALVSSAFGQAAPVIDGTLDAIYVPANDLSIQALTTGFGNSTLGLVDVANGSELDGLHAVARELHEAGFAAQPEHRTDKVDDEERERDRQPEEQQHLSPAGSQ